PRAVVVARLAVAVERHGERVVARVAPDERALAAAQLLARLHPQPGGDELVHLADERVARERLVHRARHPGRLAGIARAVAERVDRLAALGQPRPGQQRVPGQREAADQGAVFAGRLRLAAELVERARLPVVPLARLESVLLARQR